ncbi:Hsp20/alpha crystallin family protein [Halogeometricum luteum]|uniref:Hsp20/alpha crystallin family protein n=1 Tax=Halogeometricum luteum TaxID=2950537 RepID=A0ABU2G385_9EURY|nr:Hsp20/alpha crystallin family protein [Halogeometricum sp. S3BR5-2]MDS0295256.1 Hsp20/alpha crystallin family protein [Halogeometricum sp. S3BR5-2]
MSARGNPFEELERFFDRMNRQFGDVSHRWQTDNPFAQWAEAGSTAVDVVDHDGEFVVTVDLPGFEGDDVTVQVTDHTLRIGARREEEFEETAERYLRHERRNESVQRSIRLPDEVDKGSVDARMNNGVLTVTLPKTEAEEPRTIDIE